MQLELHQQYQQSLQILRMETLSVRWKKLNWLSFDIILLAFIDHSGGWKHSVATVSLGPKQR